MTNTIANRGKLIRPRLVHKVDGEESPAEVLQTLDVDASDWDFIFKSMRDVLHAPNGTARRVGANSSYEMAGKTGTAQVVGIKQDEEYDSEALRERHRDHGLFVGFAPLDKHQDFFRRLPEASQHLRKQHSIWRRLHIDPFLLLLLVLLTAGGLFVLYSASEGSQSLLKRQAVFFVIAYTGMFIIAQIKLLYFERWSLFLYLGALLLLIFVLFYGVGAKGAQRCSVPVFGPCGIMYCTIIKRAACSLCLILRLTN